MSPSIRRLSPLLLLVAVATAAAVYLLAPGSSKESVASAAGPARTTPTAEQFARTFIGTTNAYAAASGDETRIANADCVQAAKGRYMCSYASTRPGRAARCHVMQARWTPNAASTITVTLAGRTGRCGSLREALRTLA